MREYHEQAPPPSTRIFYYCNQFGLVKDSCPLLAARPVQAPTSTTLRITDECQGRTKPPRSKGYTFHLTIKEDRVAPNIINCMYSFIILTR